MIQNHDAWCYHIINTIGLEIAPEDIILVYGWTKTLQWFLAVSPPYNNSNPVLIDVPESGVRENVLDYCPYTPGILSQQSGPVSHQIQDQCLFLMYHKLRNRPTHSMLTLWKWGKGRFQTWWDGFPTKSAPQEIRGTGRHMDSEFVGWDMDKGVSFPTSPMSPTSRHINRSS